LTGDAVRVRTPAVGNEKKGGGSRQAVSGMMEAFILLGIGVVGVGALAVWFGGFGGSGTVWTDIHCTLHVDGRENVGGGMNYIEVTVENTGGVDIEGFSVKVGDSITFDHVGVIIPGEGETKFSVTNTTIGSAGAGFVYGEAVARYSDGSNVICDRASLLLATGG